MRSRGFVTKNILNSFCSVGNRIPILVYRLQLLLIENELHRSIHFRYWYRQLSVQLSIRWTMEQKWNILWGSCHWNSIRIPYWQMHSNLSFSFMEQSGSSTCILRSCGFAVSFFSISQLLSHSQLCASHFLYFSHIHSSSSPLSNSTPASMFFIPVFSFSLLQSLSILLHPRHASVRCTLTVLIQIN